MGQLLSLNSYFTDDDLTGLVNKYIAYCESKKEYPWVYYYTKYNVFRTGRYGKYWWNDCDNSPYVFTTLFQKQKMSENSYNPFLKAVNDDVSREHWGNRIYLSEKEFVIETQTSYQVFSDDNNENMLKEYAIAQNEKGIDVENRIEKIKGELFAISNCDPDY